MELKFNKDNWERVTLGDVVFEPKETAKDISEEGLEHIVGLEHIESGDIHLKNSFSADTDTTFTKVFRHGDVLFGRRRAYLKKAAQATFDGICSGDITVLRANKKLDTRLLPFVIHNDKFFDYAIKHSAGGLSPRVKFKDLANYEFLLPPKDQQAKLADLLWAMDDVIEKDLKVLESLEVNKKSAIFIHFKSRQSKLVKNKSLLKLASKIKPDNIDKEQILSVKLHLNGIVKNDSVDGLKLGATQYFIRKKGQFIYGKQNLHNGAFGIIPEELDGFVSSSDIPSFDFINSEINPSYFYLYYSQFYIYKALEKLSTGTGSKRINENLFLEQFFPLITIKEQNFFLKLINHIDQNINLSNSKLASSKALQKSLINQIF
ncbi:restriction endonuclease subunit S [Elizabethkingia miricola]|uniref:restriction endonuclease subunit S n=1 Tax=Elizabethkingia miricola TaxID=172045 RepID=UPI00099A0A7A|nr:restriction endonuclease subunit S [Elizabethkingia miricola]OPC37809.1 hypothetical protein BAX99_03325 [Elizabethkingia miricola]